MARDLRLTIEGDSKSGRKALDDVADQAAEAARATDRLGDQFRQAAKSGGALERSLKDVSRQSQHAGTSMLGLGREVERVSDKFDEATRSALKFGAASKLELGRLGRDLDRVDRDHRGVLDRLGGLFGDGGKGLAGAGGSAAASLSGGGGDIALLLKLIAGGLAAPAIGAGAGGALLFGGATAAAGAGLAGAWANDPDRYSARWSKAIGELRTRWLDATKDLGKPLERGLDEVDRIIRDLPLDRFADAAEAFADPLISGFGSGISNAAEGMADFAEAAGPVVREVAPKLGNLGRDLGDGLRAVGLGSEEGAVALGDLVDAIGYAARATGVLILGLEKGYKAQRDLIVGAYEMAKVIPVSGDATEWLADKVFHLGATSTVTAKQLGGVGDAADEAATGVAQLSMDIDAVRRAQMAMADADIALAQGWITLKKELEDGTKTLDLATQSGIDNASAIRDQVAEAERQRQQMIDTGSTLDEANKKFDENVARIRAMALAAGFSATQVDALLVSLGAVAKVNATPTVKVLGLGAAIEGTGALANLLRQVQGNYNARVGLNQGPERHAAGGTVRRTGPMVVGELGPEIQWGNQGQYISTADQTRRLLSQMERAGSGGYGGVGGAVRVDFSGMRSDDMMAQWFMRGVADGRIQIFAGADGQVRARR